MSLQTSLLTDGSCIAGQPINDARSLDTSQPHKRKNPLRLMALTLAGAATMTSCGIAVLAAWERGGTLVERLAYSAFAGVAVSGVHLLPMLSRGRSLAARGTIGAVCAAGIVTTLSGQIAFYEFAQRHAGARRAETVPEWMTAPLPAESSTRDLTAIARDQAAERTKLAFIDSKRCSSACAEIRRRRTTITATLDELQVEAEEAKRRERAVDRRAALHDLTMRQRDAMRVDPVAARLSVLTGIDEDHVTLLLDLIYAAVLDGVGAIGWYFALSGRDHEDRMVRSTSAAIGSNNSLKTEVANGTSDRVMRSTSGSDANARLEQLVRDVADGKLRATVAGIRGHLGCAQGTAAKLRREILALDVTIDRSSGGRHVR